jgi:putative ABC transport system permease protein
VLLASVLAVLLIACINVTNLILARSTTRQQELAVRASIGASRGRLVRQLFTEGVVLSILGGAAAVALAMFALRLFIQAAPVDIPRLDEVRIDGHALWFTALLTLASALIVGLVPAWRLSRFSVHEMKSVGRGEYRSAPARGSRMTQSILVAAQVSLTVVCAIVAGLLFQSLIRLLSVDKGFVAERVVTGTLDLAGPRYAGRRVQLQRDLVERLRAIPAVSSVAIGSQQLLSGAGMNLRVLAEGTTVPVIERPLANFRAVNGEFFVTLGIPIERGAAFTDVETRRVAVISRSMAVQLWPGQDAVGKRFRRGPDDSPPIEVVGVARDIRASRLDQPPGFIIYVPLAQSPVSQLSFAVKATGEPLAIARAAREAVGAIDPELPLAALGTMDEVVAGSVGQRRFLTALVLALAGAALTLAALGVFGVVSQGVSQRTPEIGIRLALGARQSEVVVMVLRQALRVVVLGLLIGVPTALASGTLLRSMLFDIVPHDVTTIIGCCITIIGAATAAAYGPARRASRVDPAIALRAG